MESALVRCVYPKLTWGDQGPTDQILEGKSTWEESCKFRLINGPPAAKLGQYLPITNTSACPKGEPAIGWNSTCEAPYVIKPKRKKKPLACRNGTWGSDHPQCKESESEITSPMDMY